MTDVQLSTPRRLAAALSAAGHGSLCDAARRGEFDIIESPVVDPQGVLVEILRVHGQGEETDLLIERIQAGEFHPTPDEWEAHARVSRFERDRSRVEQPA